ncbi:hypothetical protein [Kitasatospora sp. SUK 42]|uniref:hypothetical protein n=1 Tax=Kitasatospora sp. SUK 42 TaxID=1588882 RepID=UPI0018C8ED7F|nr:hypothetical protein [Kitasatospora sp. SUK 42]MBV2154380.1 hypothetical protein [Kitasatospora sp. SUK 42]
MPPSTPPPTPPTAGPPPPPGYPPPVAPPGAGAGYPPATGSWGAGQPYQPSSPAHRLLTGPDWRPALRAAIAPTAVLLLVALIAAIPSDYSYDGSYDDIVPVPAFGDRFGGMLSIALNAFGAPFKLGYRSALYRGSAEGVSSTFWVVPMTVTILWFLALWLGVRAGLRRRKADGSQLTREQAAGEALRTALVLGAVTALLGLFGSTTWHPALSGAASDYSGSSGQRLGQTTFTADSGWVWAVGWTVLLGGLLTFAVYGTDAMRWSAWRSRSVRGWAVAALTAGQALALTLGLASLTAFILVTVKADEGWQAATSLAFLPNIGLLLLGVGSGATLRGHTTVSGSAMGWADRGDDVEFSFFDLHDQSAEWRWTGLLALAAVAVLGWTAYRRRLDAADRLRLAVVYAVVLTALSAVAGVSASTAISYVLPSVAGWNGSGNPGSSGTSVTSQDVSAYLEFPGVLLACAVWVAVGALLVPALLAALGGRGGGAYGNGSYQGVPDGATPYRPAPYESAQYGPVPPEVPYPAGPAYGVPPQAGPSQGAVPQDAVPHQAGPGAEMTGTGVSEVIGSHEVQPTPAAGTPPPVVPPRPAEEPVDPTVWRDHP